MSQGVVRNRKAIFNVPLKIKFILKDKQFDLTYANQVGKNNRTKPNKNSVQLMIWVGSKTGFSYGDSIVNEMIWLLTWIETNPLELASLARTVLIQRPCQGSEQILNEICPKCNPLIIVRRASSSLKSVSLLWVYYYEPRDTIFLSFRILRTLLVFGGSMMRKKKLLRFSIN